MSLNFFESFLVGSDPRVPAIFNSILEEIETASNNLWPLLKMHARSSLNIIFLSKSELVISIGSFIDDVRVLTEKCKALRENPLIHLYVANCSELARLLQQDVHKMQIGIHESDSIDMLATAHRILLCQNLTKLSIIGKFISYRTIRALSNAVAKHNGNR